MGFITDFLMKPFTLFIDGAIWGVNKLIGWISKIPGVNIGNIPSLSSAIDKMMLGSKQSGGYIGKTGPYMLHAGETVSPAGGTNTFSPNITVNIMGNSGVNGRDLATELTRGLREEWERLTITRGI